MSLHALDFQRRSALDKLGKVFLNGNAQHKSSCLVGDNGKLLALSKKLFEVFKRCLWGDLFKYPATLGSTAKFDVMILDQGRGVGRSGLAQLVGGEVA